MNVAQLLSWLRTHVNVQADLCLDSRQIKAGDVFFACRGRDTDGRQYIDHAIERGASAVVTEVLPKGESDSDRAAVPLVQTDALRDLLGQVAHEWYGRPSEQVVVVAVTGTNGKTSSVQWLAQAMNSEGVACGVIGTLGVVLPDGNNLGGQLTTPDVLSMHRALAALLRAGSKVVALEASSIGLDQGRLDCVAISTAAFTNLTHDHLDYHGTLKHYELAKLALFNWSTLKNIVSNFDDAAGRAALSVNRSVHALGYSADAASLAPIRAIDAQTSSHGLIFTLSLPDGKVQVLTRLVGQHTISNLLLVAGVLHGLGWSAVKISRALAVLHSIPGRLEIVDAVACGGEAKTKPMVVIDYAHTPDALERTLAALRELADKRKGRLICVFGCGGNRDRGKRAMMGSIAERGADEVVLTSDNPRNEVPSDIIEEICSGMVAGHYRVETERSEAVLSAIWSANESDVVLLAGKGHETYQEIQGVRQFFDDREWSKAALLLLAEPQVCTDSRVLQAGQVFVALTGDRFDGHHYLEQALKLHACAALVEQRDERVALPQIVVGDTRKALQVLGRAWRKRFLLPVIAVTGSNGKTTTKEMIASILRIWAADEALSTHGNLNNDLGVPLTLLRLRSHHRVAVIELGMNHSGEIALLSSMALPTVGLVNNAQREHQEFMRSVEAVARENGAVIQALSDEGIAVFPGDDTYASLWTEFAQLRRCLRFGLTPSLDVHATQIQAASTHTTFKLNTATGAATIHLAVPGLHNLRNALAAAACALAVGAPLDALTQGLERFSPVAGRMQLYRQENGYQLIDDTYNANPDSVRAAIDVLAHLEGKKVLVLGEMGEVGENGPQVHAEAGEYARLQHIDALLTLGPAAQNCALAFGQGAEWFDEVKDLMSRLWRLTPAHILVKGSRSSRMERVVHAIKEKQSMTGGTHHVA